MKVIVHNPDLDPNNTVAFLEVIIPESKNNADYVNDVLIPTIKNTGFRVIGSCGIPEVKWCKNPKGQNVLTYFGATEGRVKFEDVIKAIKAL
jgi:hypothetical protein